MRAIRKKCKDCKWYEIEAELEKNENNIGWCGRHFSTSAIFESVPSWRYCDEFEQKKQKEYVRT